MKSDGVQRSVRTSRTDRAAGSAPDVGRVARMPGTGLPKGERRTRRRSDGGRGNKVREGRKLIVVIWSVLGCGVVVAALGAVFWIWIHNKLKESAGGVAASRVDVPLEPRVASKFPSPSQDNAVRLVRSALTERDPAKISRFFRPCATTPQGIVDFLQKLEAEEGAATQYEWLSGVDANGMSLDRVLVSFKGTAQKPTNRLAFLTPDEEGIWQIDFDAFARTVVPGWSEFMGGSVDAATVRIYMAKDTYYNGPFRDDKEWSCFGMASPDIEEILVGYCKRGTSQETALESILSNGRPLVRAVLEIRRVEGADARQFEISRVVAEDWVVGPTLYDERFK